MKTLRKERIAPVWVEFIPQQLEEGTLYISEKYATASHLCLCGCKSLTVTPLNKLRIENGIGSNDGWNLIKQGDLVSLSPSISNYQLPCKSHYIITKNVANFV